MSLRERIFTLRAALALIILISSGIISDIQRSWQDVGFLDEVIDIAGRALQKMRRSSSSIGSPSKRTIELEIEMESTC